MAEPKFLYDNEVIDGTITADSEATGFPDDNMGTWLDYEYWMGLSQNAHEIEIDFGSASPASITCIAIGGHNLNTVGARWKLDGSDDADASAPTWTPIVAYQTPANDFALAKFFVSVTYETHRLTIDNNGGAGFQPQVGVLFLGDYMEFEHVPVATGFDPDRIEDYGTKQRGETGYNLGHALDHSMRRISMTMDHLDPDWIDSDWIPFRDAHRNEPFFFAWNSDDEPNAVYLVQINQAQITTPYRNPLYRTLTLEMEGRLEE